MSLISALNRLQEQHGHLRPEDLRALAARLKVPLYRLQGLASFYPHFRTAPPPPACVALCRDMSCHLAGAEALAAEVEVGLAGLVAAGKAEVTRVSCLGRCDAAPAACVNEVPVPHVAGESATQRAARVAAWAREPGTVPPDDPAPSGRRWRIDPYPSAGERYGVLRTLLGDERERGGGGRFSDATAQHVLGTLKEAGLKGMGGAGFPTATKWELVRAQAETPRYVVVNADESEPGTFKDRVILEELPHLVIEGAVLAGLVVGAERAIIYIRHEYGRERRALAAAMDDAGRRGLLPFPVEIFVSPGGYILGEETALLEALEDRRGEPRNKPPFPVSHGLWGKPTVINNVETLALVPVILARGSDWWKEQGHGGSAGLKLIALSGHVVRPGVYEIPLGLPMRDLIAQAGGVTGGRAIAAIAPGGASSPFLPPSAVDLPLDFKALQEAGSMLGSGAVVVAAEGTDLLALAVNVVAFFRNESCGKCVPCRTGSEKAVRILEDLQAGRGSRAAVELLPQLGETLLLTSICGLGQVALNPILSLLKHFPRWVEQRLPGPGAAGRA